MKLVTRMAVACMAVALCAATAANAFTLRSPQVAFNSFMLQGYLTAWDGGINAATDQLNAQFFTTGISGNTDFTLFLKNANGSSVGVYNAATVGTPPLFELFPAAATAGYSVACHFTVTGDLSVALYDNNFNYLGTVTYNGVDRTNFGFYIMNAVTGAVRYSQDARNGGLPQVLTYAGTGINYGEFFECFEVTPFDPNQFGEFTSSICVLQSVAPTPTRGKTWGGLKATYR